MTRSSQNAVWSLFYWRSDLFYYNPRVPWRIAALDEGGMVVVFEGTSVGESGAGRPRDEDERLVKNEKKVDEGTCRRQGSSLSPCRACRC